MSFELKKDTLRAFFWSFLERFSTQGIQFVFSIIMARILLPEEFGLIAMLSVFIAFAQAFINSGFGQALIQKQNATHLDECSIFYFNIFVSFLAAGLMFLAAPWIANFYNQPKLVAITRILSVSLIFNSLGLVQRSLLIKKLDFKTQLKVSIITLISSGTISLLLALNGFGVWSLVILYISNDLLNTIFIWIFSSWRPSFSFSFVSLQSMFVFGSRLLFVSLLNSVFSNIYQLVIGKFFSASSLGLYSRADSLYKYPVTILNTVVSQVTFSTFSILQNDINSLKKYAKKTLAVMTLITFPLMIGLAIIARPLVEVLLTEKWILIVPYLQLLCIIGLINPIQRINYNILNALGRSDLFLRIEILDKLLVVTVIFITFKFGITAMIYGQIIASIFSYFLNAFYTGKLLGFSITSQIKDLLPGFAISSVMGGLVFSIKYLNITNQFALLSIQIIAGTLIYTGICYFFKLSSFIEIVKLTKLIKFKSV